MRDVGDEEDKEKQGQKAQRNHLREQQETGAQHRQDGECHRHDQMDQSLVLEERNLCQMFFQHHAPIAIRVLRKQGVDSFSVVKDSLFHGVAFLFFVRSLSDFMKIFYIGSIAIL